MEITINKNTFLKPLGLIIIILISSASGVFLTKFIPTENGELISPFVSLQENISYPLLSYSIENLRSRNFIPSELKIESLIAQEEKFDSYIFSYTTLGKKMTGQINIPDTITASPLQKHSAIIMIRGYVPEEIYKTGVGTSSAASALANNGYITVSPDFFGYGDSDPEPEDTWQARFEKPIIIIELIKSLEKYGVPSDLENNKNFKIDNFGIWAHSNGGQIALTTLEIIDQEIPTSLWAPVTAPFPYSILYFGDELEDEGKEQRKWIALFEEKYDVFDFSLTKHLDLLQGPIQIQHGDADDAALIYWSEEFISKINLENDRRDELQKNIDASKSAVQNKDTNMLNASPSDEIRDSQTAAVVKTKTIELDFYKYPGTNHNMIPNWDKAIGRDLQFFEKHL